VLRITGLVFLLVSLALSAAVDVRAANSTQDNFNRAVSYLRNVAYNPEIRLCREAPRVAPNTYWIASDNLLAFKALEPNDTQLSSTIHSKLVQLAQLYHLPTSGDQLPLSLRYDVVIRDNATLELPPRDVTHLTLYNGSYLLRYDIANGTGIVGNWTGFADLLLLTALSNQNRGDLADAMRYFTAAANMWDTVGLRDSGFTTPYGEGQAPGNPHAYATYKLGLLLYVSGKLGVRLQFEQDVINRIWSMQNQTNGGIFTHIMPNGSRGTSDTNTETTAMVILGITSIGIPEFESSILVLCVVVLLSIVTVRIKRPCF
jgi:hypothetical protein